MSDTLSTEPEEMFPISPVASTRIDPSTDTTILCPFCNKPLPSSLTSAQTAHDHKEETPTATSESLLGDVQTGDKANISAASNLISPEDLRRWSQAAGIPFSQPGPSNPPPERTIPLLPPPPSNKPDGKATFGFSANDEDSDSEDEGGAPSGYAKLDAPGSPGLDSDDDGEGYGGISIKKKPSPKVVPPVIPDAIERVEEKPTPASDEEIRSTLHEVVTRVNQLTTSHTDLLNSHSTLLTSLKIARSNLAMAEANAEMLEDELRRSKVARIAQPQARTPVTPAQGLQRAASSTGPRLSNEVPRAGPVRTSTGDKPRPTTIAIPAANLFPGPASAAASTNSAEPSKSVFGFWKGGKQKLPGGLGSVTIPSPAQVMAAIPSSRPGTPTGESRFDFSAWAPPDPSTVGKGKSPAYKNIEAPGLMRSASYSTIPSSPSINTPARQTSALRDDGSGTITAKSQPTSSSELFKLRQAYSSAVAKMSTMSTELENLKKGKVEMEAELEGLSQALFEEANKMVADERKKRLEVEEGLKEAIQEREALKKVVEVLGGQTDVAPVEKEKEVEKEEFQPRDLDKHYQALRETIHHVGDSSPTKRSYSSPIPPSSPTPLRDSTTTALSPVPREMTSPPPPSEPNPWASAPTPSESTLLPPVNIETSESSLLPPVDLRSPDTSGEGELPIQRERVSSPAVQDLDRLMEDLQADMRDP